MRRLMQSESHADAEYDRPNLPWVCGRAEEGCPCALGPTAGGRCRDETPCRPVRSGRRRRGRLAMGLVIFTAGTIAMAIGSPWRRDLLAPGPLSQVHARLIAGSENRCAACHPGGVESSFSMQKGTPPNDAAHATQSTLCMECHQTQIDSEHALSAHTISWEGLNARRKARLLPTEDQRTTDEWDRAGVSHLVVGAGVNGVGAGNDSHPPAHVACAVCHHEHRGSENDLTSISSARCQACHQEQFDSFAAGHPDFGLWPFRRRTRIDFDHNTHAQKHYATKNESFDCATCHTKGPQGEAVLLTGYEQSCARCHDEDITASAAGGVAVLSLPMLDRAAIADANSELGPWPEGATGDFDGELPAIARLLLLNDPQAAAAMDRLGYDFSFFDLDPDSPEDARDAAALAGAIRKLIEDLSTRGHEAIRERARAIAGPASRNSSTSDLAATLPIALIDSAKGTWFDRKGSSTTAQSAVELAGRQADGGWFVDDRSFTLRYVPTGHADPLLRSWITLAASLGDDRLTLRDAVLAELAGAKSAGQCATCHSLEEQGDGRLLVNWRAYDARDVPRGFTKFSHRPHLTQPELQDCAHCHQLDAEAAPQPAPYPTLRTSDFVSQFQPVTKASCIQCHTAKAAGDGCTQCHNYHVDMSTKGDNLYRASEYKVP